MWTLETPSSGTTSKAIVPMEGIVAITKPDSITVTPYINNIAGAAHHVHVKLGDSVYFKIHNPTSSPEAVGFTYNGVTDTIVVPVMESAGSAEGNNMAEGMNYFGGEGAGTGLGAGLLGGVLGGALLGGNGVLGNRNGVVGNDGVVTPALLAASLATNANVATHDTILQALGDIKASVPYAEGQVQLALAGATADINRNVNNGTASVVAGQAGINKGLSDAIATSLASQATIRAEALVAAGALQAAILNSKFEVANTVRDDGDKTRALIVAQNDATLNRELGVAQSALLEARAVGREQNNSINITNTLTQNQAQAQIQAQQQQQFQILANLNAAVVNLANDIQVVRQTQSNVNFGVQGTAGQTASAANTRVN